MAISLQKGGNVNLSKEAPGLSSLKLAWAGTSAPPTAPHSTSTASPSC